MKDSEGRLTLAELWVYWWRDLGPQSGYLGETRCE